MKNKKVFVILIIITVVAIFILIPIGVEEVTNAVVNQQNGDIAFCYSETSGTVDYLIVTCVSKEGNVLYSKRLFSEGGSYAELMFFDETLSVFVHKTNSIFSYNRDGTKCEIEKDEKELLKNASRFDNWKNGLFERSFEYGEYKYIYKEPSTFYRKAKLIISTGQKEMTIYESPNA